jgi:hypothetical protein
VAPGDENRQKATSPAADESSEGAGGSLGTFFKRRRARSTRQQRETHSPIAHAIPSHLTPGTPTKCEEY